MKLRTLSTHLRLAGLPPAGRLLLAGLVVGAALLGFAGSSRAGVSDYTGPLYLSGPASSFSGSFRILGTSSQLGLTTPVATNTGTGSGGPAGSYTWIYVTSSGGVFSASAASNSQSPSGTAVSIANVPVGSALYRQKLGTGAYKLVTSATDANPYLDTTPDSGLGSAGLPNADNRVASTTGACSATTCGYIDFSPGVGPSSTVVNNPPTIVGQPSTPSLPAACKGWIVDGANSGSVSFASGPWTFGAKVNSGGGSSTGTARLAVGLFKVNAAGVTQGGWLLNPATVEDSSTNLINSAAQTMTTASVSGTAPTFAVDASEHLCVQFYRHQTAPYAGGAFGNRTLSLVAWDAANQISAHPAPNAFADVPTPSAPADGVRVSSIPQLLATYGDAEGDPGTVTFRLCTDASCSAAPTDSPAQAATNGSTPGWTPSGLADGAYYWKADAKDTNGLDSAWSATRSFTLDRSVPTATQTAPSSGALVRSVTLSATYADADTGAGTLDFQLCRDTLCATIVDSTTLAATNGATLDWTPSLGQGVYYWRVRASDGPNTSAWSGARSFTRDTIAPTTTIGSGRPTDPTRTTSASFNFTSDEAGSFTCDLDGASTTCTSPQSYSALAEGAHTFRVHATDPAGNVGGDDTYTWTVDTTAPDASIGPGKPADPTNSTSASVDFSSNETGSTFQCELDGGSYGVCTSPKSYTGLAGGSHTFAVRATDAAGNTDPTPATYTWTIDLTAPNTMLAPADPTSPTTATSADFDFSATEAGATFECSLDGAAFASCTSRKTYTGLGDGPHTFQVHAIDPAGNVDPTPGSFSWTVDRTPPETSLASGTPADPSNGKSATFGFSASEPGSSFECSLDGGAYTSCAGSKTYTGLADGTRNFSVRAIDAAGNVDPTPATYTWRIDTAPPDTTLGSGRPPAVVSSSSATFDFTSTESGSTFRCSLDGAAYATCTSPSTRTGLVDGAHTFAVEAIDPAGNSDGSAATYSWTVDTTAPSTTLSSSGRPVAKSNSSSASFTFSSADSGASFECSDDGGAYSACTSPHRRAALPDGPHTFALRAVDAAGNKDATPVSYTWSVDTIAPNTPVAVAPGNEAWRSSVKLSATFSDPAFGGSGSIDVQLCADPLCANVVKSWSSGVVANNTTVEWAPSQMPGDGHYFWQARAGDDAGNRSAWSAARGLNLDRTAPTAPPHFNGVVAADGLTLRWDAPADSVANYVVFVDGSPLVNLGSTEFEIKLGAFDAGDPRRFSIVAVDLAGNNGAASPMLVGVPDLIGLTMTAASDALASRGLHLKQSAALVHAGAQQVLAQNPNPATLTEEGSTVQVLLADAVGGGTALSLAAGPIRARCAAGATIKLRLRLSDGAVVSWQLRGFRGGAGRLGSLAAGSTDVRIRLPRGLRAGRSYVLELRATSGTRSARASVKVVGARAGRACGSR
jgi:hypothetical protein